MLYKDACALVIIQMGKFQMNSLKYYEIEWGQLIGLGNVAVHNYENIMTSFGKLSMKMSREFKR